MWQLYISLLLLRNEYIRKKVIARITVYFVATAHMGIITLNIAAVPFMVINEPFYIWMPLITFLVSPLVGGSYCMFNRLENYWRHKAGMPLIHDRLAALFTSPVKK